MARGSVGWMYHPWGSPSTLRFIDAEHPDTAIEPSWTKRWFPDAFSGTMGEVLRAVADGDSPSISGRDNLGTMALLEAAYLSAAEGRAVDLSEIAVEP
jgi:predicted dehydrogenase